MFVTYNVPHLFASGSSPRENAEGLRVLLDTLVRLKLMPDCTQAISGALLRIAEQKTVFEHPKSGRDAHALLANGGFCGAPECLSCDTRDRTMKIFDHAPMEIGSSLRMPVNKKSLVSKQKIVGKLV